MTDRELWVKTMKTVGAMVGGTVMFLGTVSLALLVLGGDRAASSSGATTTGSGGASMSTPSKGPEGTPAARAARPGPKGESRPVEARPGESI
jgi:hypothetical protein